MRPKNWKSLKNNHNNKKATKKLKLKEFLEDTNKSNNNRRLSKNNLIAELKASC